MTLALDRGSSLAMLEWIFSLIVLLRPPSPVDVRRLHELVQVAAVIRDVAPTKDDAALLVAIAYYESGFTLRAHGRDGEVGAWQLMPPAPERWHDQAREALGRWKRQGPCGYAGERHGCVKGRNRALLAGMLASL